MPAGLFRFFVAFIIALGLAWGGTAFAAVTQTVEAEGYSAIVNGKTDAAREEALRNAFRRAVEQAVGVVVESESLVRNSALLDDRIYSKSLGYIKGYTIIDQGQEGSNFRVRISARVSAVKLRKDISEIGQILLKKGNPKVMLLVAVQSGSNEAPSNWWEKDSSSSSNGKQGIPRSSVAEETMVSRFLEKGFKCIDPQSVIDKAKGDGIFADRWSGNSQYQTPLRLAALGEADVVVVGKAVTQVGNPLPGTSMRSCQATVSAVALNADNGVVIATCSANAVVAQLNTAQGIAEAIRKASVEISGGLISQILSEWKKEIREGRYNISLFVTGLTSHDLNAFGEFIKERVDLIEEAYSRSFKDGRALFEVVASEDAKEVTGEMDGLKLNGRSIHVSSFSANVIQLTVTK